MMPRETKFSEFLGANNVRNPATLEQFELDGLIALLALLYINADTADFEASTSAVLGERIVARIGEQLDAAGLLLPAPDQTLNKP